MTFANSKSSKFFVVIALLCAITIASGFIAPSAVHADSGDGWGDTTWGSDSWGDTTYGGGWGDTTYNDGWGDTTYNDGWGGTTYSDGWGDTTYNDGWGDTTYNDGWGGTTYNDGWGGTTYNDGWGGTTLGTDSWGGTTLGSDAWGGTTLGTDSWGGTTFGTDVYGTDVIKQYGVGYSYNKYATGYYSGYGSTGYGSTGGSSSGGGFSMPSFGRAPSTSYAPSYPASQPQRPVQQQQQQQSSTPITIVNTNNNNNVNTNVNTVSVIPVAQTPVTYPVQYVYPQQPVYPIYPIYPTYPTYPIYPTTNAYCVITATQGSIANGQAAYLSWSSSGATSAWLSDGIGAVAVNGSLAVRPNVSKTYTLTVSGYGGTNTCNAYVTVQGSYISLSQIPYTGFDAGLLGNALYWLSIISFAVAGAYLAVYYVPGTLFSAAGKTQVLAFANSAKSSHQSDAYETVRIPEESKLDVVEAPVETMTPSPVDVMENLPVAPTAKQTTDSMTVEISKEGDAPRIVIKRN